MLDSLAASAPPLVQSAPSGASGSYDFSMSGSGGGSGEPPPRRPAQFTQPSCQPDSPPSAWLRRSLDPSLPHTFDGFGGAWEPLSGHAAVVLLQSSSQAPSRARIREFRNSCAGRHDMRSLGRGGNRGIIESYAVDYSSPLMQPLLGVTDPLLAAGAISCPAGTDSRSFWAADYDGGSQIMHGHGVAGHCRLPGGIGSPPICRAAATGRHTLMVGYTICCEEGRPLAFKCGSSPASVATLPHGSLWVMDAVAAGEYAFGEAQFDGEPLSARLILHGVPYSPGHFLTVMHKFEVAASSSSEAVAVFIRAVEQQLASQQPGRQQPSHRPSQQPSQPQLPAQLPDHLPVRPLPDAATSCTDDSSATASVANDGSLGDHWSLLSFYRSIGQRGMRQLWRELLEALPQPPVPQERRKPPFNLLHPGALRTAFAFCMMRYPDEAGLPVDSAVRAVLQQGVQPLLEPAAVRAVLDAAAQQMADLHMTLDEQERLMELYPGGSGDELADPMIVNGHVYQRGSQP